MMSVSQGIEHTGFIKIRKIQIPRLDPGKRNKDGIMSTFGDLTDIRTSKSTLFIPFFAFIVIGLLGSILLATRRKSSTKDVVPCPARSNGQLKPHNHTHVEVTIISQGFELIEVDGPTA